MLAIQEEQMFLKNLIILQTNEVGYFIGAMGKYIFG
jgi:hypothetical protein